MKNILMATIAMIGLLSLSCAKSGGSDPQQPVAVVQPVMGTDCVTYPQNCNTNYYNNQYGFQPYQSYNGTYFSNNGYYGTGSGSMYYNANGNSLCNCPQGTVPTYNSYAGMGCVSTGLISSTSVGAYAYFGWNTGPNNNQWMNIPQISNYVGYPGQSCYNGVVQSCMTDQQNMCGSGFTCRASSAQSRLGLCIANSGSSYGQVFR